MDAAGPVDELPLVSIVTPSLNQVAYLEEAIRSVAEQDYPRVEHIVIDGGSTDGSIEILERNSGIRWVSEPDGGQADAINKGFRMARGGIFGWLNADDYYLSGAISAAVEALRASGAGLVHGGWRQVDEAGNLIRDVPVVPFDYRRQLEVANRVAQPGSLFTREAFEAVGGVDVRYGYALDYEFWLRIGKQFPVCEVDRILAAYRYHDESKTVATYDAFRPETWRASRSHGARLRSPIYVDFYLPQRHPLLYRLVFAVRRARRRVGFWAAGGASVARRWTRSERR